MNSNEASLIITIILFFAFFIFIFVITMVSMWKLFEKMEEEGWKGIIPIYNYVVIAERVGKPAYWGALTVIPYVGVVFNIWLLNLWMKGFNKSELYTIFALFIPFIALPILAFNKNVEWQEKNKLSEIEEIGNSTIN